MLGSAKYFTILDINSGYHHIPVHRTPKNVKQFVGLASYYRRFIPGFVNIAKSLNKLLKNHEPFIWGEEQNQFYNILNLMGAFQSPVTPVM